MFEPSSNLDKDLNLDLPQSRFRFRFRFGLLFSPAISLSQKAPRRKAWVGLEAQSRVRFRFRFRLGVVRT